MAREEGTKKARELGLLSVYIYPHLGIRRYCERHHASFAFQCPAPEGSDVRRKFEKRDPAVGDPAIRLNCAGIERAESD